MSPSVAVPVFDASNSHVFEEGVERESASNKRTFMNEQVWGFIVFPAMFAFLAYFLLTSGLPLWQVAALITLLGALQTTMVVIAVRSFRRPRIHPVKITSDGALVLGPRRWELRSVTVIERSGRMLTFKDRGLMKAKSLRVDVAPDPALMTAYKDPGLAWGAGHKNLKVGPEAYTFFLGQLSPGRHSVVLRDFDFGSSQSTGTFTVEGSDYAAYAKLHEQMKGAVAASATFPEARMRNSALESEMKKLLENAGWKGIRRLAIVDKDWWIDRVAGGDSPVESRHLDAAAEACDTQGCYYKVCTFHQRSLIGGGFGRLASPTGRQAKGQEQQYKRENEKFSLDGFYQ